MALTNTIFDFNVVYDRKKTSIEKIKDALIKCALDNGFDIGIEEVETYKLEDDI